MRAALLMGHGGPEMLQIGQAADPVVGPGDVVVDVHAASVNGADSKRRIGNGRYRIATFPHILGRDFSGVVSAVGAGVSDLAVGDPVFGVADQGDEGCYAEKIAIKAAIIARKPPALNHLEAAAIGLAGVTALRSIEDTAQLRPGETILIHGGAGGVAGIAIQLARHIGARVITTASADNHDYVRGLGADRIIDYRTEDFSDVVSRCDVVFDTVGGDVQVRSYKVLKPGGRLVWIAAGPPGFQTSRTDVRTLRPDARRGRDVLERLAGLIASGAVTLPPITRYDLSEVREAHRISEARHLKGKLVLAVR
jgi:NADPH:quinone reductase-like Zn-dependent oxidoreductase